MSKHGQISQKCEKKQYITYRQKSGTGLTRAGRAILSAVRRCRCNGLTIDDAAERSGYSRHTAKVILKELEQLGYVMADRVPGSNTFYSIAEKDAE